MTVAIVGGGLAGLFTATRLLQTGHDDVVVFESSGSAGGVTRSVSRDGYMLEPGAGSFALPHPHLSSLLAGTRLRPAEPTARVRHVWTGERLVNLAPGPAAVAAPVVPVRAKLRGILDVLVAEPPGDDDESLETFLRRRLGNRLGHTAAWLAASGVYAGDPTRLSARSAFPALTGLVAAEGSLVKGAVRRFRSRPPDAARPTMHLPTTTMADLADELATGLGDRWRSGHTVDAVRRHGRRWIVEGTDRMEADHVVLACAPQAAARLVDGPLSSALTGGSRAPVLVVGLGGPADGMPLPDGFGILTGPDARTSTRGILLESSYAPHRAPAAHSLVKVIAGGAPRDPIVDADDQTVINRVGGELARILGHDVEASFAQVVRQLPGIPQYDVGHRNWLAQVAAATPESLHLTGWGYRGVGVAHLAADAHRIAGEIAA
ncbi:MAG: protoporphyrinogen oxidase [Acidimicrobiia bacterium]